METNDPVWQVVLERDGERHVLSAYSSQDTAILKFGDEDAAVNVARELNAAFGGPPWQAEPYQ